MRAPSILDTLDSIIEQAVTIRALAGGYILETGGDDDIEFDLLPLMDANLSDLLDWLNEWADEED